ncbi:MAG TPA: hypothetical protein DDZ51_26335 [Planctomycetaceae bacterium]|nr:hypothetical protein [Planctomycetaceae bacterium]
MSTDHVRCVDERWFAPNAISSALDNLTSLAATYKATRETILNSNRNAIERLQKQQFDSSDSDRQVESSRRSLDRCSKSIEAARKRLAEIRAEIGGIDHRIAELASEQASIDTERRAFEATIARECGPLGLPPFWIFRWPNPEWVTVNHRLSAAEQNLQDQHRALLEQSAAKNHDEQGWHQKRNETVQRLETATKELALLENQNREQLSQFKDAIRRKVGDFCLQQDRSLEAFDKEFLSSWLESEQLLRQACVQAREQQPRLDRLTHDQLVVRQSVPRFLCIGRKMLRFNEWQMSVPMCIPFPFPRTLICDSISVSAQSIAIRTLLSCPLGQLSLVIIDPRGMGNVVQDLLPLLDDRSPIEHGKVLTLSDEIEAALASEFRRMEDIIQRRLTNRYATISEFNRQFPESPIAHRLVIYADFPEQATDRAIGYLERLQELGPKAGISVILSLTDKQLTQSGDRRLHHALQLCEGNADRLSHLLVHERYAPLMTTEVVSDWTLGDPCKIISAFGEKWREWSTCRGDLTGLIQEPPWAATARDDLRIPIGWGDSGSVSVEFGQEAAPHALVGGRSGSGKSNLIHVLISSACHRYSPDHLRIGLLDFKQGVEFARYANGLPHAEIVSVETDRMLGVQVLEDYKAICEDRAKQFAQHGVRDYSAWCESRGVIPRHLIIIDEFQILFESDDALSSRAATALARLAKQGRAFGVHLLLATQTLSGITNHVKSLAGNLGIRIALACTQEDSNLLLSHNNSAASQLKSPPEALLNTQFGDPSQNRIVSLPHASDEILDVIKELQTRLAQQYGISIRPHVHFANRLAEFPRELCIKNRMLFGERLGLGGLQAIPIEQILSKHVLLVSQDADARLGTLLSIAASLRQSGRFNSIVSLSSGSEGTMLADHVHSSFENVPELIMHLGTCAKPVLAFLGPLETISELAPASFGKQTSGKEAECRSELEEYLLISQSTDVVVVAWSSNWRAVSRTVDVRKFLKAFDFRIASGLSADDCFALFERRHDAISVTRGLAIDVSTDQHFPFKPFGLAASK